MNATDVSPAVTLPETPRVGVLAVVGVGLIGGSFAAALRQAGGVATVLGAGRRPQTLERAQSLGLIDEAVTLEEAAARADLILLAVPVGATKATLACLAPHLRSDTLLTDAGSTKVDVEQAARDVLGDRIVQFIPGHPIAGAEATGPDAARADLYRNRTVVLTPLPENRESDRLLLQRIWEACGARVVSMQPDTHDSALASVSHMPHLLAAAFMAQVAAAGDSTQRMALAGTGFRDFTRIAAGSPEMWRDIFQANRKALLEELAQFKSVLNEVEQSLQDNDGPGLYGFLERAALARRFWGSRSRL